MKHLRKFNESLDDDLIKSLQLLQKRLEGLNLDVDKIGHLHRYTKETLKGRINGMTKQVERLIDKNLKKTNEEFDSNGYESHWVKFTQWLSEKDFELYDGGEDLHNKFMEVSNDDNLSSEDKASQITDYLDKKWGISYGYMSVYNYLESLFMDEI